MKIGAQLYTLRTFAQTERDLARTLEKVARMGYDSIQLSGVGAITPKQVKKMCDDNGLAIAITHNDDQEFLNKVDALIEKHHILGCKYVGLGALHEKYRQEDMLPYFAKDFEDPARKIKDAGMLFMYHNHAFEFAHYTDGRPMMDHIMESMPEEIMGITADTYWLQFAGLDVCAWLEKHAKRLPCVHLKDLVPNDKREAHMAALGQGNMNFKRIMEVLSNNQVTEYALVEQDDCYGESPFKCMEMSRNHLKTLGY